MTALPPGFTVEETLRVIQDRSAFLRHFGDSAALNLPVVPDARVFSGLADAAGDGDIEGWARAIHDPLWVEALGAELGQKRRRR